MAAAIHDWFLSRDWVLFWNATSAVATFAAVVVALCIANRDRSDREMQRREERGVERRFQEISIGPRIAALSAKLDSYCHHIEQCKERGTVTEHSFEGFFKLDADSVAALVHAPESLPPGLAHDILRLIGDAREIERAVYMGTPILSDHRVTGMFNFTPELRAVVEKAAATANRVIDQLSPPVAA